MRALTERRCRRSEVAVARKTVLELPGFAARLEAAPFQINSVDAVDSHVH
jgi:hypothetical protein